MCMMDLYVLKPFHSPISCPHRRVQNASVISASNLFKITAPCHSLLIFHRHHPHDFRLESVSDLLSAAEDWFARAHEAHPQARFLILRFSFDNCALHKCLARRKAPPLGTIFALESPDRVERACLCNMQHKGLGRGQVPIMCFSHSMVLA